MENRAMTAHLELTATAHAILERGDIKYKTTKNAAFYFASELTTAIKKLADQSAIAWENEFGDMYYDGAYTDWDLVSFDNGSDLSEFCKEQLEELQECAPYDIGFACFAYWLDKAINK
jgi:hypothetical protein